MTAQRLKTQTAFLPALALSLVATLASSMASANECRFFRATAIPEADLRAQATAGYISDNVAAFTKLEALKTNWPALSSEPNASLVRAIESILRDEELSVFHKTLDAVFTKAQANIASIQAGDVRAEMRGMLAAELEKVMPRGQAETRANVVMEAQIDKRRLFDAIRLDSTQSLHSLVGAGGIRNVSPDSMVGRFVQKASELGQQVQTFVGTFNRGPGAPAGHGPERLYVTYNEQTLPLIQEIFGKNPHFLAHHHTNQQGTLYLHHEGQSISYAGNGKSAGQLGGSNTIVPLITLSTTEASRASNYFNLGALTSSSRAKYPWSFLVEENGVTTKYCRTGGYDSCTHWVGEMAIGDRPVDRYKFPGIADQYAGNQDPTTTNQAAIREAPVGRITHFNYHNENVPVGYETRIDRLSRIVWKERQGNMQLWEMLQSEGPLSRGEYANPGWVLYNLLGTAPADRVPVVLIYRPNPSEPLSQATIDSLSSQINPI